jgi:phosphatidylglycerol lysyltransferase
VMAVQGPDGAIVAFANLIHDGVPGEATIDLMRRRPEPAGVMDYLFGALLVQLKADGYHGFSLGLSPLAAVGTAPDSRLMEQALHQLYEHLNRVFSYKGLHAYKDKFHPSWEPSYLVYRGEASLPMIALALIRLTE